MLIELVVCNDSYDDDSNKDGSIKYLLFRRYQCAWFSRFYENNVN